MNGKSLVPLIAAGLLAATSGCISHHETVTKDVGRLPVSFESDTAARHFYEGLEKYRGKKSGTESRTEFHIPIVFEHEVKTVNGPNAAFNDAVRRCDTNQDGKITEQEARIFLDLLR